MAFYVGQKVVCVNPTWGCDTGTPHQIKYCPNLPQLNAVYTIRGLHNKGLGFLWLNEIYNAITSDNEPFFEQSKFRAMVSTKTDISIYTAMLGPKVKERIDG